MSDFKAKISQIRFPLGLNLRPRCDGSLQRSSGLLAVFKGPTSKTREGEGAGKERCRGGEGRGIIVGRKRRKGPYTP